MRTYTKEIKESVIGRIKKEGISCAQASKEAGIPDNTLYVRYDFYYVLFDSLCYISKLTLYPIVDLIYLKLS